MSTQHKLRKHGISTSDDLTHRIMRIIVESAALYSLNHLLYVILYEVKNQVESTPSFLVSFGPNSSIHYRDACPQEASLASITCSLIIVRSEDAMNQPQTLPTSVNSYPTFAPKEPVEKYAKGQDGMVYSLQLTGVIVDVSTTVAAEDVLSAGPACIITVE